MYEDYLMHHGILGQKWGIRRYQNADGTLTEAGRERYARSEQKRLNKQAYKAVRTDYFRNRHTVPAGTKMYRTTTTTDESSDGPAYVSYLDVDRYNYRGGWVRESQNAEKSYEIQYRLKKDITVPSRNELSKTIYDIVKKDPSLMKETASKWFEFAIPFDERKHRIYTLLDQKNYKGDRKQRWEKASEYLVKDLMKKMGDMPISQLYFMSAQTFGSNIKLKNAVIEELKNRGYGAMTDECSVGGQNGYGREGMDPLIIFDRRDLEQTKIDPISYESESEYRKKTYDWWKKADKTGGEWGDTDGVAL